MQSFIHAHNPTNFEVHSLSTLENHIFKFSLPLSLRTLKNPIFEFSLPLNSIGLATYLDAPPSP